MPFIPPEPPAFQRLLYTQRIGALCAELGQARQALIEAHLTFRTEPTACRLRPDARSQTETELAQARAAQQELIALVAEMRA